MTPKYLPGDVLRMTDGNLWHVVRVLPAAAIYTLSAQTALPPVSVTCTGRELDDMGAVKVARLPEQIRTEAMKDTFAELDRGADRKVTLESLWDLAFLTGLAANAEN